MQQKQRLVVKLSLVVGRKVSKKTLFVAVKSLEGGLHGRYETICAATVKCLFLFWVISTYGQRLFGLSK